jgi:hypothetical protein
MLTGNVKIFINIYIKVRYTFPLIKTFFRLILFKLQAN